MNNLVDENGKFLEKYRIESSRCKPWDYSSQGYYFVTICTRDREPFFGKIAEGKMELSDVGVIAETFLKDIEHHFSHIKVL
ncbi:MAG: hypothetical protein G01um101418_365 [Parcubacteria group bacterium Gr01-1014_18]|nr:MAG: hypothetical protein Greene041636_389 [Parcubacteria group bacterium Greene0416_36]TSC81086.1 MAG: hypothetical protein G01um101418_365 [Parcubacteria group bacterium Gr01-1014_18]TSC98498.1 MAG: hypothetical protein Greene101420_735 [Parcubacteria group bacterium Greene1014_20]TSD07337.1 MAG: hypothetical protein Greene07142_192 [Parcubacteria group bacterium Greene0714_2]